MTRMAKVQQEVPDGDVVKRYEARLVDAAKRYASYDHSDPFTMDRCCGHIRQGLCAAINPFREEVDEDGRKRLVPTGLPWYWQEGKKWRRTELIGDAGAPGHYDALELTTMHDGQVEIIHKNLRRP